jgi:hypothetical protein
VWQHPIWDPEQKKFYYEKVGQATNYIKHWCTCMPSGEIEVLHTVISYRK